MTPAGATGALRSSKMRQRRRRTSGASLVAGAPGLPAASVRAQGRLVFLACLLPPGAAPRGRLRRLRERSPLRRRAEPPPSPAPAPQHHLAGRRAGLAGVDAGRHGRVLWQRRVLVFLLFSFVLPDSPVFARQAEPRDCPPHRPLPPADAMVSQEFYCSLGIVAEVAPFAERPAATPRTAGWPGA